MSRSVGRFSARDRVRKRSQFRHIQAGGAKVVSRGFVFLMVRTTHGHTPRLGITASRRVGNSPRRNRAKRLVREAFRALRPRLPQALDLVVIVRRPVERATLGDVVAEWDSVTGQIHRRWERLAEPEPLQSRPGRPLTGGDSC